MTTRLPFPVASFRRRYTESGPPETAATTTRSFGAFPSGGMTVIGRSLFPRPLPFLLVQKLQQILPVSVLPHRLRERDELPGFDISHPIRHLLDAGDFQALPLLDHFHERAGLQQGVVRPGV